MMKNIFILIITGLVFSLAGAPPVTFKNSKHAWKILNKNKFAISRRSAYIYLTGIDSEREKAWHAALVSNDPVLRRDAISNIFRTKGEAGVKELLVMKPEKDKNVQDTIVAILKQLKSRELRKQLAGKISLQTDNSRAGELFRVNIRLKNDPTFDHEVETFRKIPMNRFQWKIWADSADKGVKDKLFAPKFKENGWKNISVDKHWETQGLPDYNGFAWYRVSFKAPEKKEAVGAEFYFPMVDEEAWVWLNGSYLGQRANGPDDWNKPFYLDASQEIRWGEVNQLTVRVFDSDKAGGICKVPELHLLR